MHREYDIDEVPDFLLDTAVTLVAAGAHTSRIVRNVTRMAESFGYNIDVLVFQKTVMMTVTDSDNHSVRHTSIRKIKPMSINFDIVSQLSALSWKAHDTDITLRELKDEFRRIVEKPRLSKWIVLMLVACANASFCRLFQGDVIAMGLVFGATFCTFYLRQELTDRHINHFVVFILCSFAASMFASVGILAGWGDTQQTAVATSVLFLIPGVPLINSVIDILEGNVLIGTSRLINAVNLIVCIAIGLFMTLSIIGIEKL